MAALILILATVVLYVIDVVLGSDATQYDCEVGSPSYLGETKTLSRQEFFGYLLPLILVGLGTPLIFAASRWGFLALSTAAILYLGRKLWISTTSP